MIAVRSDGLFETWSLRSTPAGPLGAADLTQCWDDLLTTDPKVALAHRFFIGR